MEISIYQNTNLSLKLNNFSDLITVNCNIQLQYPIAGGGIVKRSGDDRGKLIRAFSRGEVIRRHPCHCVNIGNYVNSIERN